MEDFEQFLKLALESEYGIKIPSSEPQPLINRLYRARADSKFPSRYAALSFTVSPDSTEVWILNGQE